MDRWMELFYEIIRNLDLLEEEIPPATSTLDVREELGVIAGQIVGMKLEQSNSEGLLDEYIHDLVDVRKKLDIASKQERLM